MLLTKYYLDIGCVYEGSESIDNAFADWKNWDMMDYGLLGILKLKIDTDLKKKKEVYFRQVLSPYVHKFAREFISDVICDRGEKDILCALRDYRDADLVVGWNSRDFDLPIIINNLNSPTKFEEKCLDRISKKDRDLLDICISRDIDVKGGLKEVIKRLRIEHDFSGKDDYYCDNDELCFLTGFERNINAYNNNLRMIKQRNEFDIRILPLLEERLGYLYAPRLIQDKFHKKW